MTSKKRHCTVQSGYSADGSTYRITIQNIISEENCFTVINKIVKAFVNESELYFGFYRTDGLTLTKEEWKKYQQEIPLFFCENGEYKEIVERIVDKKGRVKEYSGYLSVAKTKITDQLYDYLKWILQYYLETTFFPPKISFNDFETDFKKDMQSSENDYLEKGYTSFLFRYYDSGNFSVSFDPRKYDVEHICNIIKSAF